MTDERAVRQVPSLTTGKFLLRAWRQEERDRDAVLQAAADPLIRHYSPSLSRMVSTGSADAWLADRHQHDRMEWVVEEQAAIVGRVSLARIDDESGVAEVGYWVLPVMRGRGVAATAVTRVKMWAFSEGSFGRLEIEHELDNVSSCRVAQRCGFALEGVKRKAIVVRDARQDVHLHARLATDD